MSSRVGVGRLLSYLLSLNYPVPYMRLFEICGLCFFLLAADLALFCAYWEEFLVWSSSFGSGRIEVFRLIGFDRKLWFKLVGKTDEKLVW